MLWHSPPWKGLHRDLILPQGSSRAAPLPRTPNFGCMKFMLIFIYFYLARLGAGRSPAGRLLPSPPSPPAPRWPPGAINTPAGLWPPRGFSLGSAAVRQASEDAEWLEEGRARSQAGGPAPAFPLPSDRRARAGPSEVVLRG